MRILMIEDDAAVAHSMELMMLSESWNVQSVDMGEEGLQRAKLYEYDCITLDLNLPDMSGYDVLKRMRMAKVRTPVIIVSGLAGIEDKVKGLGIGADDYMTKPFHKDELIARIHAVVRRSGGHAVSTLAAGPLTLNLETRDATVHGEPVRLTGKQFQMLECLMLRKGVVQSKDQLLNAMYGGRDEPEIKIIDVFICKLRQKLDRAGASPRLIETIWGRGYLIRSEAAAPDLGEVRALNNHFGRYGLKRNNLFAEVVNLEESSAPSIVPRIRERGQ